MTAARLPYRVPYARPASVIRKLGGLAYYPDVLFESGQQGFLYDTNDLGTMFQDNFGTVPIVPNEEVQLQFDIRLGAPGTFTTGVEINGDPNFNTPAYWNNNTGAVSVTGGSAIWTAAAGGSRVAAATFPTLTAGRWYRIEINIVSVSGGIRLFSSSTDILSPTYTTPGVKVSYARIDSATQPFLDCVGTTTAEVTSLSVKEIAGNHRYQTSNPTAPILRGTPAGSTLVVNGDFTSGLTGWTNPDTAPGTTTASGGGALMNNNTTGTARLRQQATVTAGSYRIRFNVSGLTGSTSATTLAIGNSGTGDSTYGSVSLSRNGDYEVFVDNVASGTLGLAFITVAGSACSLTIDNVDVRNVSAGSVQAPYGLQFSGSRSMRTQNINFSGSDKAFICMGYRPHGTTAGVICEVGSSVATQAGSFLILPGTNNVPQAWLRGGTSAATVSGVGQNPVAGIVHSALFDLAGTTRETEVTQRVNGVAANTSYTGTADDDTGNLATGVPLYFGARASASVFFNGLEFGGVCRVGALPDADTVSNVEGWEARQAGVTF